MLDHQIDRSKLASLIEGIALYMEILGENPFKVRAHQNGAKVIEATSDLDARVENETLDELKGIGPALQEKIKEFAKTGTVSEYTELQSRIPAALLTLVQVPGLGPKKARVVYEQLGIKSLGELEYACRENRLAHLPGFGEKSQEKILQSLEFLKRQQNAFLYSDASLEALLVLGHVRKIEGIERAELVGALRRRAETVRGIGIVVSSSLVEGEIPKLFKKIKDYPGIAAVGEVLAREISFTLQNGLSCKIKIVLPSVFASELLFLTGNKEHVDQLKDLARKKGAELYGSFESEAAIFKSLGLDYIEPELREGGDEVRCAQNHQLPKLIEKDQIRGVFHCHTTDSDGANSLEEMVAAAQDLGLEYIGISDHSVSSLVYANGLKKERVLNQFKQIEQVQKKFKIKIFRGIESDILSDGSLDYDDELLGKFDFVIGSVHSGFSQKREQMTKRVLTAIANPFLDFLGHPTGRLLLARDSFEIDMESVIAAAAEAGVAVEVNANPQRLDMDWRFGKFLKEKHGIVSINPDAHSVAGLEDIEFGVGIARKGWLTSDQVINTLSVTKIMGRLRRARAAR